MMCLHVYITPVVVVIKGYVDYTLFTGYSLKTTLQSDLLIKRLEEVCDVLCTSFE